MRPVTMLAALACAVALLSGAAARPVAAAPWAAFLLRQSSSPDPAYSGEYPACASDRLAEMSALIGCRVCFQPGGGGGEDTPACPPECCVAITESFNRQLLVCRPGGCCARLLIGAGEPRGFVGAFEPASASGGVSPQGACGDINLADDECGPRCAFGFPNADATAPTACDTGYDMPALDDTHDGTVACVGSPAAASPAASPPALPPGGDDDDGAPSGGSTAAPSSDSGPSTQILEESTAAASDDADGGDGAGGDGDGEPACFPADARVALAGGGWTRMDALRAGDEVRAGGGERGAVLGFTHAAGGDHEFVALRTRCGRVLRASAGHYVYSRGALVAAGAVAAGDRLALDGGGDAEVAAVRRVVARGLYNPQTTHGDIVVDGFVVSTYTTAVAPALAHAALSPARALFRTLGWRVLALADGFPAAARAAPQGATVC